MLWDGCVRPLRVQKYSPTDNILTKFLHPASLQILNPATIINKKALRPEAQVGGNVHEESSVRAQFGSCVFFCYMRNPQGGPAYRYLRAQVDISYSQTLRL